VPSFSERMGITQPRDVIQRDSIDTPLRNMLWNLIRNGYLTTETLSEMRYDPAAPNYAYIYTLFWGKAGDEVPTYSSSGTQEIRQWYMGADWWEVYNFVEFVIQKCSPLGGRQVKAVEEQLNYWLERHMSAYRWIGGEFAPITDEEQIGAIEEALESPLAGVRSHLSKALKLLADREDPDEENSIKESISALESLCSAIVGKKATLGDALKKLKGNGVEIHGALEKGWLAMYGYTSDADGIRHASQAEPDLTVADAMYFLVSCSAFITLLTEKSQEAGLSLTSV
jgi:hypothetical protein